MRRRKATARRSRHVSASVWRRRRLSDVGLGQLVRVLLERRAPPGWLSLFCAVTFLFAALFAFLGILSTYLARMYVTENERGLDWVRRRSDPAATDSVESG